MSEGEIFFAEVDPGTSFNPVVHNVFDQQVMNLTITQDENQFAIAEVEIINNGDGLLNPTRKKRVFISEEISGVAVLQFSGRIVGYPNDLSSETVKVLYLAQPEDWEATQKTFFDTLKVGPFYNDLYVSESRRDIEGDILAGYSSFIYWDRIDETIQLSDIIEGTDFIDLSDNIFFDTIRTEIGDPPLKSINLNVEVQWEQFGVGEVNAGLAITAEFTNTAIGSPQLNTLTPLSFEDAFKGVSIPNGYSVLSNKLSSTADDFGLTNADLRSGIITVLAVDFPTKSGGTAGNRQTSVARVWYQSELKLQAVYQQKRRENLKISVSADIQDIALINDKPEELFLRLQDPAAAAQGSVFSGKKPSFFTDEGTGLLTTLGREVVEHGLMRVIARLKKTARVVEVQFECPFELVRNITTDTSIRFDYDRFPGGQIRGKVTSYILDWDGDSGQRTARIRIASTIGLGIDGVPTGAPGEVEVGLRIYDNEFGAATMESSIFYDLPVPPVIENPIDVEQMENDDQFLIDNVTVTGDGETQKDLFLAEDILTPVFGTGRPDTVLQNNPTRVEMDLKPLNPEDELQVDVGVTIVNLTLPKHVDLEA